MGRQFQRLIDWMNERLAHQSQTRLAAIMGVAFGLLLCVVVLLILLLVLFIASLR